MTKEEIIKALTNVETIRSIYNIDVRFRFEGEDEINNKLNEILSTMKDDDEKLSFCSKLFKVWCTEDNSEENLQKLGKEIFGSALRHKRNLYYTVTLEGGQFRVWYEKPDGLEQRNGIGRFHIDSGGSGLMLSIEGHPSLVMRYKENFMDIHHLEEKILPSGIVLCE